MSRALRILVADDDGEMRALLAGALSEAGYRVTEVDSGTALLAELRNTSGHGEAPAPNLIITDVRMPGWTGLEILSIAQMLDCDTPFLLITAFGDDRTHALARELGAIAVFNKPFELDELVATVRLHLPSPGER